MPTLSREAILAANDLTQATIDVPEWGGSLVVRGLTLGEVNRIVALSTRGKTVSTIDSAVYTFIAGVVEPKFTDMDADDLKKKSAVVLRVVKRINELSGIGESGAVTLDDAEKN